MLLDGTLDGKGLVGREFGRLWMRLEMGSTYGKKNLAPFEYSEVAEMPTADSWVESVSVSPSILQDFFEHLLLWKTRDHQQCLCLHDAPPNSDYFARRA